MKTAKAAALALALASVSAGALADTANFEGLSVYLGASTMTTSMKVAASSEVIDGFGKTSFTSEVGADYGLKLSDTSVVLLGGTYGLGSIPVYTLTDTGGTEEGKIKTRWSVFAAPGVTFGKDVLLYGKLAYVSSKPSGDGKTHTGLGYGLGARFALSNQAFLNIEFLRNDIGKKTYGSGANANDVSGAATAGTVALGYRF